MEKQATLALLEREGWELHDLPADIAKLQQQLSAFERAAVAAEDTAQPQQEEEGVTNDPDAAAAEEEPAGQEPSEMEEPAAAAAAARPQVTVEQQQEGDSYHSMAEQYLEDRNPGHAAHAAAEGLRCLLYTSPSPRD